MGDGDARIQIVYLPGFTTLSAFLPIIGLFIAFAAAAFLPGHKAWHRALIVSTGIVAGLSIVGMHYVVNFGIRNYTLHYQPRFFAASIIIAVGNCLLVVSLFYTFRELWINSWYKRFICALFLAGGVTAMHFTAATSCEYLLTDYNTATEMRSRDVHLVSAVVFSGLAAVCVVCLIFINRQRWVTLDRRSRKVMLSCVIIDSAGRLLVTGEGLLPSQEITGKYSPHNFQEDLDTAHELFHWIFRVTRNWSSVEGLVPDMKAHLSTYQACERSWTNLFRFESKSFDYTSSRTTASVIFREQFCVAAMSLASALHVGLNGIGTLYDQVVETGTISRKKSVTERVWAEDSSERQTEFAASELGKGQCLFLSRTIADSEATRFLDTGFRFAEINQVSSLNADTMQIPHDSLIRHLTRIKISAFDDKEDVKTGTWLAYFILIPRPHRVCPDVMVKKNYPDQLPDIQLLPALPDYWQTTFLGKLDGLDLFDCLRAVEVRLSDIPPLPDRQFLKRMQDAILELSGKVPEKWNMKAIFSKTPLRTHTDRLQTHDEVKAALYSFTVVGDMHTTIATGDTDRIPINFFRARHLCCPPHETILGIQNQREFRALFKRTPHGRSAQSLERRSIRARGVRSRADSQTAFSTRRAHDSSNGAMGNPEPRDQSVLSVKPWFSIFSRHQLSPFGDGRGRKSLPDPELADDRHCSHEGNMANHTHGDSLSIQKSTSYTTAPELNFVDVLLLRTKRLLDPATNRN